MIPEGAVKTILTSLMSLMGVTPDKFSDGLTEAKRMADQIVNQQQEILNLQKQILERLSNERHGHGEQHGDRIPIAFNGQGQPERP